MGMFLLAALLLSVSATAAEEPLWVTAEGASYQGEMDTPHEVRERARRDAQAQAIEKAVGSFIKAHTLTANFQIAEDLIYSAVRGKIAKEEILSSDWDAKERNLYRVKIKALVEPVYPERGEGLSVKLSLSKTDLKEGEEVLAFYQASADAYAYLFSVAADGSVTLLLPSSIMPDNFIRAGRGYQFPPAGSPLKLKAMALPDNIGLPVQEKIKIIVTVKKEELLPLGFKEGAFRVYDAKSTGMIGDLVRRLTQMELSDWAEATAVYYLQK